MIDNFRKNWVKASIIGWILGILANELAWNIPGFIFTVPFLGILMGGMIFGFPWNCVGIRRLSGVVAFRVMGS